MPLRIKTNEEILNEKKQAAMIIANWQPWFTQQYGGGFPRDYFTYDVESCGFSRVKDVIVEWGHCIVRDCEVVDRNSVVLNWFLHDTVPHDYIRSQLLRVERAMQLEGRSWRITAEVMQAEGIHPMKVLPWIYDLMTEMQDQKMMLVAHNGWNFDNPMLIAHFAQDLQKDFKFNPNQIMDTGCIEKASQLADNPKSLPQPGETLLAYFKRISGWRAAGVYSNLDTHCVKKYRLDEKYGIDSAKMHSAGQDAYVLHLLMEEFRKLAGTVPSGRNVPASLAPVSRVVVPTAPIPRGQPKREIAPTVRRQRNR